VDAAVDAAVDPAALARLRAWGGGRLAADMAALFLAGVPERLAAARRALAAGDRAALAAVMHALRAGCAQLGGSGAAARCAALEQDALDGAPDAALADGLARVEAACAALGGWLADAAAGDA
jgi:HPt (histidine-containing phosphotransfer) domain-containing protein